jgi:hypothetical protein
LKINPCFNKAAADYTDFMDNPIPEIQKSVKSAQSAAAFVFFHAHERLPGQVVA